MNFFLHLLKFVAPSLPCVSCHVLDDGSWIFQHLSCKEAFCWLVFSVDYLPSLLYLSLVDVSTLLFLTKVLRGYMRTPSTYFLFLMFLWWKIYRVPIFFFLLGYHIIYIIILCLCVCPCVYWATCVYTRVIGVNELNELTPYIILLSLCNIQPIYIICDWYVLISAHTLNS